MPHSPLSPDVSPIEPVWQDWKNNDKQVKAMLQQDMTGFIGQNNTPEAFGVVTDNVSLPLTDFTKLVIDAVSLPPKCVNSVSQAKLASLVLRYPIR